MRTNNLDPYHGAAAARGRVAGIAARGTGLVSVGDGTTEVSPASTMFFRGARVTALGTDDETAVITIEYQTAALLNNSGGDLVAGTVVVIDTSADDAFTTTTTAQDTLPVGILAEDIAAAATGAVIVSGIAPLVSVGASVTRGHYVETSGVAGEATGNATRRTGSFGMFLEGGTTPAMLLFGSVDTTGPGTFVTVNNGGDEAFFDHGASGATETIDLADGNWHRVVLTANCTFTLTGATAGKGDSFLLELVEDGTGGWSPTWPGSVVWPGGTAPTHPSTAGSTTLYVFETRDGGTTWYGFAAGGIAFDATTPATQAFGDAGTVGTALTAPHRDHKHPMPPAAITSSGLTMATAKLLGRSSASTGAVEEITVGTNLTLAGGTLSAAAASSTDASIWRPVLDGATGAVLQDGGTGEAIMAFGPA